MTFLNHLKEQNNLTVTKNGEMAYTSTLNELLDLSTMIGNTRFNDPAHVISQIKQSYISDKLLTAKLIAYARDVRYGGGDKTFGRVGFMILANMLDKDSIEFEFQVQAFIEIIAKYGSYKDVMYLLDEEVVDWKVVKEICYWLDVYLTIDESNISNGQPPQTLLAKYMPTETTKDKEMKKAYRTIMKYSKLTPKEYRKRNTHIRKHLNLVETKMTEKNYKDIDYSKVPSQAAYKYREAFLRNDTAAYTEFLKSVSEGETKINTGTLAPYQIVSKVIGENAWSRTVSEKNETLIQMWDNLQRPDTKGLNVLPVVDVSGSMTGLPMEVAISLGMILAESMTGEFKDHFMTFSKKPTLEKVTGNDIYEKVTHMKNSEWGMNTDLEKVFELILETAVKNNTPMSEMPEAIVIFSDMNFDMATHLEGRSKDVFFEKMLFRFLQHGYGLPTLIFWNIGYGSTKPVVENTQNTMLVSGFSQNIFNSIFNLDLEDLENYTPLKALLETLGNERYKDIEDLVLL